MYISVYIRVHLHAIVLYAAMQAYSNQGVREKRREGGRETAYNIYVYMYTFIYIYKYLLIYVYIHIICIYIYTHTPPPLRHDRPLWGRGRVVSVPMQDLPTDGRQSPLPNLIPKFPNFQHSPQPFFPKFPKCLSFPPNVKDRLCQMGHRFLDFFGHFGTFCFFVFFPLLEFLKCLAILEISTRSCNAPSPSLSLRLNLSIDSISFLVLTLVPRFLFVVALILVAVLVFVSVAVLILELALV